MYASGPEVRQYFEDFAAKYHLANYCKTSHKVTRAQWDQRTGHWWVDACNLETKQTINQECDILINATGVLNKPQWPAIPGLHDFQGKLVHSADWDECVDLKNKRIGLIGNGYAALKHILLFHDKVLKAPPGLQVNRFSKQSNR